MSRRWNGNQYTRRYLRRYERQAFNRAWRGWTNQKKTGKTPTQEKPEEQERGQAGIVAMILGAFAVIGLLLFVLNEIAPALALVAILALIFFIATH